MVTDRHVEQTIGKRSERERRCREIRRALDEVEGLASYRSAFAYTHLPRSGARILDFGCSEGFHTVLWRKSGNEVVGVDVDPDAIRAARANYPDIQFELTRGKLPFEDGAFSDAVMLDVIEHVDDEAHWLAELSRVLAPGGRLVLTTPYRNLFGDWMDQDNLFFNPAVLLKARIFGQERHMPRHRHYDLARIMTAARGRFAVQVEDYSGGPDTAFLALVHKGGATLNKKLLGPLRPAIDRHLLNHVKQIAQRTHFREWGPSLAAKINLVLRNTRS